MKQHLKHLFSKKAATQAREDETPTPPLSKFYAVSWGLFIIITLVLLIWPPYRPHAQQHKTAAIQAATKDTATYIQQIKTDIKSKFDSMQAEIKRIKDSHKPRYITRTHTRKINHYIVDSVMVFIDTCLPRQAEPLPQDSIYKIPERKPSGFQKIFKNLFHHKKPREDYMKVVPKYY